MNNYKFVRIYELYAEAGVSFSSVLSQEVWRNWSTSLNSHLKPDGLMNSKYKDFTLDFLITSSAGISDFYIKGPRKGRKNKFLEYALWIPYSPVVNNSDPLKKLTEYFKQGVREVLEKLEYPAASIKTAIDSIE